MKAQIKYIMSSLMIMTIVSMKAQEIQKFPRLKALLMETQLSEIKKSIVIDNKNISKFDQIYREYIFEVYDLNSKYQGPALFDSNLEKFSDQEVEDIFIKQTDKSKRLLILREKYFYEFKRIMKPREIIQMYEIERDIMRKVQQEIRNRVNNRQIR